MFITKNYQYHNLTIRVETSQANHHIWLQEFLVPHFQIVNEKQYDCQVIVRENNSEFHQIFAQYSSQDHHLIDCFIMDSKVISLPSCNLNEDELTIFDKKNQLFFIVSLARKEITLLTSVDNRKIRISLMRVIRELAMNNSINRDGLFIHGSAFCIDDKGVIFAGKKGAGKTTLLLHSLTHPSTNYLSNDRVLVYFKNDLPIFRGMPTITSILPSSLDYFPKYKSKLMSTSYRTSLSINEANQLNKPPKPGQKSGKFGLSPKQFCDVFEVSSIPEVEGWKLIFPKIIKTENTFRFKQISSFESQKMLSQSLFGGYSKQGEKNIFNLGNNQQSLTSETLDMLCHKLVNKIKSYECELGSEIYDKDKNANQFMKVCLNDEH